ncbi:MAG: pantetheine-phosphate adenylyltransferase [Bacteroidales bacterium]|nr:pantetheine-phosphate adenylyltransferase [Bacteroidales bacterium]
MKRAIFPGSFDPFTIGHESIVIRALALFDEIIIAIGYNSTKKGFFTVENRIKIIKEIFKYNNKIKVEAYNKLTVEFCKENKINFILRGLRTASDFEYERAIAQMNHYMAKNIETVFLLTEAKHTPVSSTILREILKHNGNICQFIPKCIDLKEYM